MSTNGKSAIALEESVICSRWEFSSDMFARILKLWIAMESSRMLYTSPQCLLQESCIYA